MTDPRETFKRKVGLSLLITILVMLMLGLVPAVNVFAQTAEPRQEISVEQAGVAKFGLVAAAAAFGFGAIGAAIAIAHVGSAAMAAIGEKPEIASQALIFIALAEGLVVFGFITALMILGKF